MIIRLYNPEIDREALRAMHAEQGFDYVYPNFEHPEFFSRLVVEDQGKPVMALMGRYTCEMFLLMYPNAGAPRDRLLNFISLHQASERDLFAHGIQDAHAFIPPGPRMSKFKKLLAYFGWVPATEWECWTKPQLAGNPQLPTFENGLGKMLGQRGGEDGAKRATTGAGSESAAL